ncbi:MAG TPA: hypothetical protein VK501_04820 [Baekduia sp.]|uniref:hypothetical protein n=1 Tax=Baekduia sp. TaxID=2600305 RepID=UPI002C102AEC|nr:hypothetical protein [Baekduia sp.]HMJ33219.1 hypothetical protein [Baekduia sp.]
MNPWVAISSTGDRRGRALRLARAHDAVLRELLEDVRSEGQQVLLVCDTDGTLLWIDGDQQMLDDATGVHLQRGARWSEAAAGTNAMHDPVTGELLGVLDLSGPLQTAHPHSLALVTAAARMVEGMLAWRSAERVARQAEPAPSAFAIAPAAAGLRIAVLGRDRAVLGGVGLAGDVVLSRRHSELLVLLALRPEGMTAEEIAIALYGDFGKPVTARAELSRLRRVLGPRLLAEPYRLAARPRADFLAAGELAGAGRLGAALDAYPGPLLPRSEVELVVEAREALDHRVRSGILRTADPALLHRWIEHPAGRDDLEACRLLLALLPPHDDRRSSALSHLRRLAKS